MSPRALLRGIFDRAQRPLLLAVLLLVGAALMPPITLERPVYRHLVVFDITQSMGVEDVQLDGAAASRLALARQAARLALRDLPCGSQLGWGVFTDFRVVPLVAPLEVCRHYDALLASLEAIDGRMRWANASSVGKGVYWMSQAARQLGPDTAFAFVTDGQEAPPLRPGQAPMPEAEIGPRGGVLIGVGSALASPIPRSDTEGRVTGYWRADEVVQRSDLPGSQSREELSRLDEAHLKTLAAGAGLAYARLERPASLTAALMDPRHAHRAPVPVDLRWLPAGLALLLIGWRHLPTTRLRAPRARRPAVHGRPAPGRGPRSSPAPRADGALPRRFGSADSRP